MRSTDLFSKMTNYIFEDKNMGEVPIGKLVCLARTYKKHALEMNSDIPKEPALFLKPASAVIFDGDTIIIPEVSNDCISAKV